jgi:hypothetical protein
VHAPAAEARIGGGGLGDRDIGEHVDRPPTRPVGATAVDRARRNLGGRPVAATAAGLIRGDGAVEGIARGERPPRERQRGEAGELGERLAAGG